MRHAPALLPVIVTILSLPSAALAVDGDRQTRESEDDTQVFKPVPWAQPNLQIQTWFTAWDADESRTADPGGYGDPEHDIGFTIARARLGLAGGWRGVDYNLRFGTARPYDAISPDQPLIDLTDAWVRAAVKSKGGLTSFSVGQQRVPFSREQQMSSNDLVFQEVSVNGAWLAPNRDIGAAVSHTIAGFTAEAGVFNGNGDFRGNPDNGVMAAVRVDYALGGDTFRTNANDSAFGIGGGYVYNKTVATQSHTAGFDLIGRYKGLTLQVEGQFQLLDPDADPVVLPPGVPETTRRLGGFAQLSYYREVGIGAIEPAVRFAYLDDATHLDDNGDVGILHGGVSWREPIPFLDFGAAYIHRMEFQGRSVDNDTVRVWAGFRYPSRHYRPFDIVQALRGLGGKPLQMDDDAEPAGGRKKKR